MGLLIDFFFLLLVLFLLFFLLLLLAFEFHGSVIDFFLTEEILTSFHLDILYSWLLLRWEGIILLLLDLGFLLLFEFDLFELGQKFVPVLVLQSWVFHKLSLDHELLNVVNGMNIFHSIYHDSSHYLYIFEPTYQTHCSSLN